MTHRAVHNQPPVDPKAGRCGRGGRGGGVGVPDTWSLPEKTVFYTQGGSALFLMHNITIVASLS